MSMNFGTVQVGPNGQVSLQGLESGIQTSQIVQALLTPYTEQVNSLTSQQSTYSKFVSDWQSINSDVLSMQTAASALSMPSSWGAVTATSSNTSVATATASSGTPQASTTFTVNQLATADTWLSQGSVASTGTVVDTNATYLLSQASAYGFSDLSAVSGLSVGSHSVDVTQAASAAYTTGSALLGTTTSITSSNNTIQFTLNGTSHTITLAAGTYSQSGLASQINSQLSAAGIGSANGASGMTASLAPGGYLTLSTNLEDSTASLQVTGGTAVDATGNPALSPLGMEVQSAAAVGTTGQVSLDGGSTLSLTGAVAGQTYPTALSGPNGSIQLTMGNGVGTKSGSFTATNVSTGSGSLADVVSAINNAATGVTASAVQTGSGAYILQLTSSKTGTSGSITDDPGAFSSSGLGLMSDAASPGTDAVVTVGSGSSAYAVASQTNTVTGLLPGLSVQVLSTSSSPVTVQVSQNVQQLTTQVQNLVDAANKALADANQYGGYNASTKTAGDLSGQPGVTQMTQDILSTFATTLGTSGLSSAMAAGISVVYNDSTGQTTSQFNQSQFQSELQSNPSAVQNLFAQGASLVSSSGLGTGTVSFVAATNSTAPGQYTVNVTQPATQSTDTGNLTSAGTVSSTETLTVTQGSSIATYTTTAGETGSQVVAGLNAAFASASLGLSAGFNGSGNIQISSNAYGSATTFSVSSNNSGGSTGFATGTYTAGVNVQGSITDVATGATTGTITGTGQFLAAPGTSPFSSLTVAVTATAVGTATLNYQPGIAQSLATVAQNLSDPVSGTITAAINGLNNASSALNSQITFYTNIKNSEQTALTNEFAQLEATLGMLSNQKAYLQAALAQGL